MRKSRPDAISRGTKTKPAEAPSAQDGANRAQRETVESIVVAVILAFLFRAFVAEAFVIPTGSMAPTLQGRHMDVTCEMCGYNYRAGASGENEGRSEVVATNCPICRFTMELDKKGQPNQRSFNGDRILVSKFAYEIADPHRWDVIVFKYPGNAKQNYIKRLVGLPNETLWIFHGDIYTRSAGEGPQKFRIARKPPDKLRSMMQVVDDTNYVAEELVRAGWPPRWQDWSATQQKLDPAWRQRAGGQGFETTGRSDQIAWLRYRHVPPRAADWVEILKDGVLPRRLAKSDVQGQLITDYYAYNDGVKEPPDFMDRYGKLALGMHWVGDLSLVADAEVQGDSGQLWLDLVKGGVHYTCGIEVATGNATLSIDGGQQSFVGEDGQPVLHPQARTALRGRGKYQLQFSNCDHELLLWVNNHLVTFEGPTTYQPAANVKPKWSQAEPGDLEPLGIGAQGLSLSVSRLQVLRDEYYVAVTSRTPMKHEYEIPWEDDQILDVLTTPQDWNATPLFDSRRDNVYFELQSNQFFPMGDNSPQSKDGRLWSETIQGGKLSPPPYVSRELLTGQALVIYWPHSWRAPIPFTPNLKRMGLIR
ncbi:MAG: signal peptidase I [Planctomycetota bacterium]|nr:signal peptidase I [Planctomycetota bacterium]